MRAVALLATYNEARFIRACLDNLIQQGFCVYLIDNTSTDATAAIARDYLGKGLIGIETLPRFGHYTWARILARKEELAMELDGDWFMHVDADEIRLPPPDSATIAEALTSVEEAGFNAVNFFEFTFVPTLESPDHDHPEFQETMRWYYPFLPSSPNRLNLWRRQPERVQLAPSGGHRVAFSGLRRFRVSFPMRHYLYLSREHAIEKYIERRYDPEELKRGWHRARAALRREDVGLISEARLRRYSADAALDATDPLTRHPLFVR